MTPDTKPAAPTDKVQGEGDYDAARRYDKSVEEFARSGKVDEAARAARPDNAQQAAELERAEREGASHAKGEGQEANSGGQKR